MSSLVDMHWSKYYGDARYSNQLSAIAHTLERFRQNPELRSMMFISPTQAGKTTIMELMIEAAHEFWKIPLENIVVFTGLSDNAWRNQTVDRIVKGVKVFHRGATDVMVKRLQEKKKLVLLVDEAHFGSGEDSLMDKVYPTLAKHAGFGCEKSGVRRYLEQYDVRIFDFSATPDLMLMDKTLHWDGYFETAVVEPGPGYYGIMDYLRDDRVRENFEMTCPGAMKKTYTEDEVRDFILKVMCVPCITNIADPYERVIIAQTVAPMIRNKFVGTCIDTNPMFDIHHQQTISFFDRQRRFEHNDLGLPKYRYTIVRAPFHKDSQTALVGFIRDKFPDFDVLMIDEQWMKMVAKKFHTSDLNELIFGREPQKPTIVFVKERLRVAKTITKTFLGDVFERWVPGINHSTQIQGLAGRVTGYDRAPLDTLVYMNKSSAELYKDIWDSGFKNMELLKKWTGDSRKHSLAAVTAYGGQERLGLKKQKTHAERVVSYGFKPAERIEIEGALDYKQLKAYKEGYKCFLGVTTCDPEMERVLHASYKYDSPADNLRFHLPGDAKYKNVFKVYASASSPERVYYVVRYDGANEDYLKKCTWSKPPPALLEYTQTFFELRGPNELQMVSWNCAGQSETQTMKDFACRHGPHCDIIFLQECRTTSIFWKIWEAHNFYPHDDEKGSTGVVTLFRGKLKDRVSPREAHDNEHIRPYSLDDGVLVCNVYLQRAHWDKDLACLSSVIDDWKTWMTGGVIIGGDFNSGLTDFSWENAFHMSSPSFKDADPEHQRIHIEENKARVKNLSETIAKFDMEDASEYIREWDDDETLEEAGAYDGRQAMTTWGGYKLDHFFVDSKTTLWNGFRGPKYSIDYFDELGVHGSSQSHRPIMLQLSVNII